MTRREHAANSAALPRAGRALPWALVTPALGWTLLFFVLPFVAMGFSSLHGA